MGIKTKIEDGVYRYFIRLPPWRLIPPHRSRKWDGSVYLHRIRSRSPEMSSVRLHLVVSAVASACGVPGVSTSYSNTIRTLWLLWVGKMCYQQTRFVIPYLEIRLIEERLCPASLEFLYSCRNFWWYSHYCSSLNINRTDFNNSRRWPLTDCRQRWAA